MFRISVVVVVVCVCYCCCFVVVVVDNTGSPIAQAGLELPILLSLVPRSFTGVHHHHWVGLHLDPYLSPILFIYFCVF